MSSLVELDWDQEDFVIRVPRDAADEPTIRTFVNYLSVELIARRSKLTADATERLAEEVKQAAWMRVKHLFEPER
jgi:hypothetical protein